MDGQKEHPAYRQLPSLKNVRSNPQNPDMVNTNMNESNLAHRRLTAAVHTAGCVVEIVF